MEGGKHAADLRNIEKFGFDFKITGISGAGRGTKDRTGKRQLHAECNEEYLSGGGIQAEGDFAECRAEYPDSDRSMLEAERAGRLQQNCGL